MHLLNPFRRQSSETAPHAMLDTPHLTPKTSFSDTTTTEHRQRALSMPNKPRETVERRRSSPSLSSHLFDHKSTPNFFNETLTIRSSTCSADSGGSEIWIAECGLYTVPSINESSDEGSYDPFSSASDAKSVFLDSLQDDSDLRTPKNDTFLSFTPSSSRSSILSRRVRTSSN